MSKNEREEPKAVVRSLNVSDLDVEELEKRLELASAGADADCYSMSCGTFNPPPK